MRFEWDELKRQTNFAKHGIDFEVAAAVFADITVTIPDERQDYGERRFITLGALRGRVVVVAHTQRGAITRIISMRKANEREQRIYQAHTQAARRDGG